MDHGARRELAPGDYTLRLDQLGSDGQPVARLETPFTRVRQPPVAGEAQVDYVIVQPGNSLWRIARRLFGRASSTSTSTMPIRRRSAIPT